MGFYKKMSQIDGSVSIFGDDQYDDELYAHTCKFPDTGLQKSWCKCGKEATYKFELGKYTEY